MNSSPPPTQLVPANPISSERQNRSIDTFEHRRKAPSRTLVPDVPRQVRSVLEKLDLALQLEEAKHKKELAAERAATVAAQAELKALVDGGAGGKLLSVKEALERAESLKKRANEVLADTRYPEAVEHYTLGIKVGYVIVCMGCGSCTRLVCGVLIRMGFRHTNNVVVFRKGRGVLDFIKFSRCMFMDKLTSNRRGDGSVYVD